MFLQLVILVTLKVVFCVEVEKDLGGFHLKGDERLQKKLPLMCTTSHRIVIEKISHDYKCERFITNTSKSLEVVKVVLWNKNVFNNKLDAYVCGNIVNERCSWPYFWKGQWDKHYSSDWYETMQDGNCRIMNLTHRHPTAGNLVLQNDGSYSTENSAEYPPTGHQAWDCCQYVCKKTNNAFLRKTKILVDPKGSMTSPAGSMSHCSSYMSGSCGLTNNLTIHWTPIEKFIDPFVFWEEKEFWVDGDMLISKDHKMALTGKKKVMSLVSKDCSVCGLGRTFEVFQSDQGMFYSFINLKEMEYFVGESEKNALVVNKMVENAKKILRDMKGRIGGLRRKRDVPTTASASAAVQASIHLLLQKESEVHRKMAYHACQNMELTSKLLMASASNFEAASIFARTILGVNNIYAEVSGEYLSIYACLPIEEYKILPMNNTCTRELPIRYVYKGITGSAFMDPITRRITKKPVATDCSVASEILVDLEGGPYIAFGPSGHLIPAQYRPSTLFPLFNLRDFKTEEIIVPEMDGLQISKLFKQLTVDEALKYERAMKALVDHFATTSQDGVLSPSHFAKEMFKKGVFGLIFDGFDWWGVWITLVSVYVTVQFLLTFVVPGFIKAFFNFQIPNFVPKGNLFNVGDGLTSLVSRFKKNRRFKTEINKRRELHEQSYVPMASPRSKRLFLDSQDDETQL